MKMQAVVLIPLYKIELTALERISLEQVFKILSSYDIYFIIPDNLQINFKIKAKTARFHSNYFRNTESYNRLMLDPQFYRRFDKYEYILLYQLDAFVFEDKLHYFCNLGYDYIGAPWLYGNPYFLDCENTIWYVGNGGLSLRHVQHCIELIENNYDFLQDYTRNEDLFFSIGNMDSFKVAPVEIALEFSFEREVKKCFLKNNNRIPFGCHAWERYDLKFWKPYIESFGYKIDKKYLNMGNQDMSNETLYENFRTESFFWENKFSREIFVKILCTTPSRKKKNYIWGAGRKGKLLGKILSNLSVSIDGYIDNNAELKGTYIGAYPILAIEEYEEIKTDVFVIIALDEHKNDVASQLDHMGCHYGRDYIFYKSLFDECGDNDVERFCIT